MENNANEVVEIDLKDLMFAVLHKWRPVLAVAVIMAVLLGGAKGTMTYRKQNDPETAKETRVTYQNDLELYEKNKSTYEREMENLRTDIANQQEYLDHSIWINMSPYDVCEARADLFISTGYQIMPGMEYQNRDNTDTILQAYQSLLTSSAVLEDVAKQVKTEPRYLEELVEVTIGANRDGQLNRMLTIDVKHTTKEDAKEVLDAFLAHVDDMHDRIATSIGEHTVSIVNESVSALVNLNLAELQRQQTEKLTTLNDSLQTKQTAYDELEEPKEVDSSKRAALKSAIKYGILGGILGGFLIVFGICVAFVMSDKLYSAKELRYRYKVKVLGKLSKGGKKAGAIDAWLNRLEGRACNVNAETEYGLIAANIKNYADGMKTILVTGDVDPEVLRGAAEALEKELSGIHVISGNCMLEDAETVKKLPECDGVVFVEQCGMSKYSALELEIERVKDLGKSVVGCVVLE